MEDDRALALQRMRIEHETLARTMAADRAATALIARFARAER